MVCGAFRTIIGGARPLPVEGFFRICANGVIWTGYRTRLVRLKCLLTFITETGKC